MNSTKNQNFTKFYKTANIIYSAIIFGLLAIMALFYFNTTQTTFNFTQPKLFILIGFASIIFISIVPKIIYKKILNNTRENEKTSSKFRRYLTGLIVLLANYEGVGLLNTLFFSQTGNKVFLIFSAFSVLYILMIKPHPDKIATDLNFSERDKEYIDNPDKEFD